MKNLRMYGLFSLLMINQLIPIETTQISISNLFLCEDEFICDLDAEDNLMFDFKKTITT